MSPSLSLLQSVLTSSFRSAHLPVSKKHHLVWHETQKSKWLKNKAVFPTYSKSDVNIICQVALFGGSSPNNKFKDSCFSIVYLYYYNIFTCQSCRAGQQEWDKFKLGNTSSMCQKGKLSPFMNIQHLSPPHYPVVEFVESGQFLWERQRNSTPYKAFNINAQKQEMFTKFGKYYFHFITNQTQRSWGIVSSSHSWLVKEPDIKTVEFIFIVHLLKQYSSEYLFWNCKIFLLMLIALTYF